MSIALINKSLCYQLVLVLAKIIPPFIALLTSLSFTIFPKKNCPRHPRANKYLRG